MESLTSSHATTYDPRVVPQPPRLHWGWVFVLSALTRSLFGAVWLIVQANWIRRITANSGPMRWAIANLCAIPVVLLAALGFGIFAGTHGIGWNDSVQSSLEGIIGLVIFTLYVVANFQVRAALEAEPIGLPLGGVMTFFFGPLYFQYFLYDYVLPEAADVFGPIPPSPAYVPATSTEASR